LSNGSFVVSFIFIFIFYKNKNKALPESMQIISNKEVIEMGCFSNGSMNEMY
jgi:hypothetical protein